MAFFFFFENLGMSNDISQGSRHWDTRQTMRGQRGTGVCRSSAPGQAAHQYLPPPPRGRRTRRTDRSLAAGTHAHTVLDSATPVMAVVGAALGPALADVPQVT